jgi:NAD(P)-dependent dehydrogenase (short-subunit alcohol dehydrogenase family)
MDQLVQKSPAGRSGSENDVAEAVQFLVQNTFVTGETLVVDGGYRLV